MISTDLQLDQQIKSKTKGRRQKKNGKISDIVQNSNYPLPPCPNNDEWKNDKSQQSIGPSLLKEIMTN